MTKREAVFTQDARNKKLIIERSFAAPLTQVWNAWTQSEMLDQWWAPKPYHTETKSFQFKEGGHWLYEMVGPKGDRTWCKESYQIIHVHKSITNKNQFSDADGGLNPAFPVMQWLKQFEGRGAETNVVVEITFNNEADLETIVKMGFKEGFSMGLNNLDEVLANLAE